MNSIYISTTLYIFLVMLNFSSLVVVFSKNTIQTLIFLVISFVLSTCILLALECEFLAFIFIVIYVGAIAVLFLFAVMMLEYKFVNKSKNYTFNIYLVFFFILFFLLPFLNVLYRYHLNSYKINHYSTYIYSCGSNYANWIDLIDTTSDIEVYGQLLYSYFVVEFLLVGLILLVVLIGVIYLTNLLRISSKNQISFKQLSRRSKIF